MAFNTRSLLLPSLALAYPLLSVLFVAGFIALHGLANQVPQKFLAEKMDSAFRHYNLSPHNYPFSRYGAQSVLSNIGQNHYTECAVLLSVLASGQGGVRNAVLPPTAQRADNQLCSRLKEVVGRVEGGKTFNTRPLRTRYWWGARAIYSTMLRYFTIYEIRELVRNTTSLAYMALGAALLFISPGLFWTGLPLLVFGLMFSGISYYSELILGAPYLWAILAATLVAGMHAARIRIGVIHLAVYCSGMISSYLWLLDGHLMLILAWLTLIGYFASLRTLSPSLALLAAGRHILSFAAGFSIAYIGGQLVKMLYLGIGPVWKSLGGAVAQRSSELGPGNIELNLAMVLDKTWAVGYWWTGLFRNELLWSLITWSSLAAGCLGILIFIVRVVRGEKAALPSLLVCLAIAGSVLVRLILMKNHSYIHAFFIGRYMFIPFAMGWVMLLAGVLHARYLATSHAVVAPRDELSE